MKTIIIFYLPKGSATVKRLHAQEYVEIQNERNPFYIYSYGFGQTGHVRKDHVLAILESEDTQEVPT